MTAKKTPTRSLYNNEVVIGLMKQAETADTLQVLTALGAYASLPIDEQREILSRSVIRRLRSVITDVADARACSEGEAIQYIAAVLPKLVED